MTASPIRVPPPARLRRAHAAPLLGALGAFVFSGALHPRNVVGWLLPVPADETWRTAVGAVEPRVADPWLRGRTYP